MELKKTVRIKYVKSSKYSANSSFTLDEAYAFPLALLAMIERAKKKFGNDDFDVWITVYSRRKYVQFWAKSNTTGAESV